MQILEFNIKWNKLDGRIQLSKDGEGRFGQVRSLNLISMNGLFIQEEIHIHATHVYAL